MKTATDIVNRARLGAIILNDHDVASSIVETNNRLMLKVMSEENQKSFWKKLAKNIKGMFVPIMTAELEVAILLLQNWAVFVYFQEQNHDCEFSEDWLTNFRSHESVVFDQYCETLSSNDKVLFNHLVIPAYRAIKARMQHNATEETLNTDVLFLEATMTAGWRSV